MNNKVKCDKGCGEEFSFDSLTIKKLPGMVKRYYFKCNHCTKEYTAYYTDPKILESQKQLSDMYQELRGLLGTKEFAAMYERCNAQNMLVQLMMGSLRAKMDGDNDTTNLPN